MAVTPSTTIAQNTALSEEESAPKTEIARGVVFDDQNGNGKRDRDEPGIKDVRVSNGTSIVKTDPNGQYELSVDDDSIIFVIKPRDWATPLNRNHLPQFYYIHKPNGSPKNFRFAGVAPTGPLPKSIDFPLLRRVEPDKFKAIMFGDPQPQNVAQVEYMSHDVIEQIISEQAHGAAFGVTLGDIVFDDLSVMEPHNQSVALIGIPWYNVIGNHDLNLEAATDDQSDETFERIYGPSYYSFDYGPTHFMVLDDVHWHGPEGDKKGGYHGGFSTQQMTYIRNDLALIPKDQLVVLMMHIPLDGVRDREELYRLIEKRPATVSLSAHTHYMEHRFLGEENGWKGAKKHHHIVNVTVCGSWWRGRKDERGIPHATMSDGGPNGYSIMEFDGQNYKLEMRGANRPAAYQMNLYAPETVAQQDLAKTDLIANVFNGSEKTSVSFRVGKKNGEFGKWQSMKATRMADPAFEAEKEREESVPNRPWTSLPGAHSTPHIWTAKLPADITPGTQVVEVRATNVIGKEVSGRRIIHVRPK
ncbi:calcineurin-like phosphoesterase family protein [Rubripirellula sp.]|nr:calcineurin-like phosphoesterase family protein [Rubripirellula sp.]